MIKDYRIIVPGLHASFRRGDWYIRNPEIPEKENGAWEPQDTVIIRYAEDEEDMSKFKDFGTGYIEYALYYYAEQAGISDVELDAMQATIVVKY